MKGFSLIELMVSVAILGVLGTLTIAAYDDYRGRALDAEAKTGLAALFSAEEAFRAEFATYSVYLDAVGFKLDGEARWNFGFDESLAGSAVLPGVPAGDPNCVQACPSTNCTTATWTCHEWATHNLSIRPPFEEALAATFAAGAHMHHGQWKSTETVDGPRTWMIDDQKNVYPIEPGD